eukprot:642267-Hanusia_phi.AAC.4
MAMCARKFCDPTLFLKGGDHERVLQRTGLTPVALPGLLRPGPTVRAGRTPAARDDGGGYCAPEGPGRGAGGGGWEFEVPKPLMDSVLTKLVFVLIQARGMPMGCQVD